MLANIFAGYSVVLALNDVTPIHLNGLALLEMWDCSFGNKLTTVTSTMHKNAGGKEEEASSSLEYQTAMKAPFPLKVGC